MRYLTYILLLAVILLTSSCVKELAADSPTVKGKTAAKNNVALTGKWKLVESLLDPGDGSGKWLPVTTSTTFELNTDGTTSGTTFTDYVSYAVTDSVTLAFKRADATIQNYLFVISNDTLSMSPNGPIRCIEGCGIKFKKE